MRSNTAYVLLCSYPLGLSQYKWPFFLPRTTAKHAESEEGVTQPQGEITFVSGLRVVLLQSPILLAFLRWVGRADSRD